MNPAHSRPIAISSYIPPKDPAAYPIPLVRQPSLAKCSSLATSSPEHIAKECGRSRQGVLRSLWRKLKEQGRKESSEIEEDNRKKLIFEEDANIGEPSGRISTAKRTDSKVDERVPKGNTTQNNISDATEGNPAEMKRERKTKSKFIERQEKEPSGNKIDNTSRPKPDYSLFDVPLTGLSPYIVGHDLYIPMPHARREFLDPRVEVREFWPVDARYDGRPIETGSTEEKKQETENLGQNSKILDSPDNIRSHARAVEDDDTKLLANNLDNEAHSYNDLPPRKYGGGLDSYSGFDLCSKSELDGHETYAGLLSPFTKHYSLTTSHASDSSLGVPTLSSSLRSSAQSYDAHDSDLDYPMSSPVRSSPEPKTPSSDFIEDKRAQSRIQLLRALVVPRRVGPMGGNGLEESRKTEDGLGALGWGMGDRRDVRRPV